MVHTEPSRSGAARDSRLTQNHRSNAAVDTGLTRRCRRLIFPTGNQVLEEMMAISAAHILGWFDGPEGYNVLTRNFADALARRMPVYRTDLPRGNSDWTKVAGEVKQHRASGDLANILFSWGDQTSHLRNLPGLKIACVIWETSKLPDSWLEPLREVDRYWVVCAWVRDMMIDNGFDADTIDIVPLGMDVSVFNPDVAPEPVVGDLDGFKFITVGRWQHRKGTTDLLRAFDAEFAGDTGARLILSCANPNRPDIDMAEELRALNLSCLDQLTFLPNGIANERMAGLFTGADAAVFPTRSDPWGLPISEAMACGLPVIATNFSGPADYMTADTAYPLAWEPAPCPWMPVTMADGDYGMWSEPDFDQLRSLMRHVYENRDEARAVGARAASHIAKHWTWDHAAEKAANILADR
jgi:glycosyltransferase involved in cell wall biosynthesis